MKFTVTIASPKGTETIDVPEGYSVQPIDFFADQCHDAEKGTVLTLLKDGIAVTSYIND